MRKSPSLEPDHPAGPFWRLSAPKGDRRGLIPDQLGAKHFKTGTIKHCKKIFKKTHFYCSHPIQTQMCIYVKNICK